MALNEQEKCLIQRFRSAVESYAVRELFGGSPVRIDREDAALLSSRFPTEPHLWYVLTIQPCLRQFHIGIVTDDADRSKDFERMMADTGLTYPEFVQLGFEAAGLAWRDPPVQHFRDHRNEFFFSTPVGVTSIDVLDDERTVQKAEQMLRGYHLAFSGQVV